MGNGTCRESRKEKVRNDTIRVTVDVGKNILGRIQGKNGYGGLDT
jgi:translation initiation factor IF-1